MICFAGCVAANCRGRPPCLPEQRTQIPINSGQTRGSAPTVGCRLRWCGVFVQMVGQLLAGIDDSL